MKKRTLISAHKAPISRSMGPHVKQVIPSAVHDVDPFVFLDHFGPLQPESNALGVPPHPHAGIATITYLLTGSNRHQDSIGSDVVLQAGDLGVMHAGKGIVHAEGMETEDVNDKPIVHGLQFWLSLPASEKWSQPRFDAYQYGKLPEIELGKSRLRVLIGEFNGQQSPVFTYTPTFLWRLNAVENEIFEFSIPTGYTVGMYVVSGELEVEGKSILPFHVLKWDLEGDQIVFKSRTPIDLVLFGGLPHNEPIVAYGPFVMNSMEEIQRAMDDYEAGKFGEIDLFAQ